MTFAKNIKLIEEINAIRKVIIKKQKDLHNSKMDAHESLNEKYKPIIEPIRDLTEQMRPIINNRKTDVADASMKNDLNSKKERKKSDDTSNLPKFYLNKYLQNDRSIDKNRTGLRFKSGNYFLGSKIVTFKGNDLIIGKHKYKGTTGLYELVFLTKPKQYLEDDVKQYMDIVENTGLIRKNYDGHEQTTRSSSYKYKTIIRPHIFSGSETVLAANNSEINQTLENTADFVSFEDPHTSTPIGRGIAGDDLLEYTPQSKTYVYWNNINEIVERLVLLHASRNAGNNNHKNEILRIEEELREASVIY